MNHVVFNRLGSLIVLILFLSACNDGPKEEDLIAAGFPDDVGTILLNSCAVPDCHVSQSHESGLDLSSWEKMFAGSLYGSMVVPYQAEWSQMFQQVNTYPELGPRSDPIMPFPVDEDALSQLQVQTLKNWIDDGAKDRGGNYRWSQQEVQTNGKVFSLCAGSDLVAVTDLASNLVMRYIEVGILEEDLEAPHFIILSPDQQYFYVTLIEGELLEKYRTDTYELVGRVQLLSSPALIELNPAGNRAIVSHFNPDGGPKLTMVDVENMQAFPALTGPPQWLPSPHGIQVNSSFTKLYVGAGKGNSYFTFDIVGNGFDNPEEIALDPDFTPFPSFNPYQLFLSPDDSKLFISCNTTDEIRVFDTSNDSLLAVIGVGTWPRLMDYDPISGYLFVACRDEENQAEQGNIRGCISVIDTENLSFVKNIFNIGNIPHGVAVSSTTRRVYITSENSDGLDELHHPVEGLAGIPGKYNVIDIASLEVIPSMETEIAAFPNATVVSE